MYVARLQNPTDEQITQCIDLLSQAFYDDPLFAAVCERDLTLLNLAFRNAVITSLLDCEVWVAGTGEKVEDGIEAYMGVVPPGLDYGETPNAKGPHQQAFVKALPAAALAWRESFFATVLDPMITSALGSETAERDAYYISHLGVSPSAQGKGLSSSLVRNLLQRAKEEGETVVLFTGASDGTPLSGRNIAVYQKLGFQIKGIKSVDCRGTPATVWALESKPTA